MKPTIIIVAAAAALLGCEPATKPTPSGDSSKGAAPGVGAVVMAEGVAHSTGGRASLVDDSGSSTTFNFDRWPAGVEGKRVKAGGVVSQTGPGATFVSDTHFEVLDRAPERAIEKDVATVRVGPVSFVPPEGWKQVEPANRMRRAEFHLPGHTPEAPALMTISTFERQQTTPSILEGNVQRWSGQFKTDGKQGHWVERRSIHGRSALIIGVAGAYLDTVPGTMNPGTERAGWALRGLLFDTPDGLVTFKLTAPADVLEREEAGWEILLETLQVVPRDP